MNATPRLPLCLALLGCLLSLNACAEPQLERISLPAGFRIDIYASGLDRPRAMALGEQGTVFVGSCQPCRSGKVYAIRDTDADDRADEVIVVADGLRQPVGVAFHAGSLYVSAVTRILRFDDIESRLHDPPEAVVVASGFPDRDVHQWRFIGIGPDNKLYVPVGAPCNICDEPGFAAIRRMNLAGSGQEVFARGVRNTVGFAWHPRTGELWFTDNGRDRMGDDLPPDELNHAPEAGMHFGYPYCHGRDIADPEFNQGRACSGFTPPARELGAHVAPLGLTFYTGSSFPAAYHGQIFIAEHGSWNRSRKSGYRITLVRLEGDRAVSYEPFAQGWLQGQRNWGRPVDLLVLPDGSLLVSDDQAGVIYRISHPD